MLLLTRRPHESIILTLPDGTEVRVMVMGVVGNQVKVGIAAPRSVSIAREELLDREPPPGTATG